MRSGCPRDNLCKFCRIDIVVGVLAIAVGRGIWIVSYRVPSACAGFESGFCCCSFVDFVHHTRSVSVYAAGVLSFLCEGCPMIGVALDRDVPCFEICLAVSLLPVSRSQSFPLNSRVRVRDHFRQFQCRRCLRHQGCSQGCSTNP